MTEGLEGDVASLQARGPHFKILRSLQILSFPNLTMINRHTG